jgi:hypothetical protein
MIASLTSSGKGRLTSPNLLIGVHYADNDGDESALATSTIPSLVLSLERAMTTSTTLCTTQNQSGEPQAQEDGGHNVHESEFDESESDDEALFEAAIAYRRESKGAAENLPMNQGASGISSGTQVSPRPAILLEVDANSGDSLPQGTLSASSLQTLAFSKIHWTRPT